MDRSCDRGTHAALFLWAPSLSRTCIGAAVTALTAGSVANQPMALALARLRPAAALRCAAPPSSTAGAVWFSSGSTIEHDVVVVGGGVVGSLAACQLGETCLALPCCPGSLHTSAPIVILRSKSYARLLCGARGSCTPPNNRIFRSFRIARLACVRDYACICDGDEQ